MRFPFSRLFQLPLFGPAVCTVRSPPRPAWSPMWHTLSPRAPLSPAQLLLVLFSSKNTAYSKNARQTCSEIQLMRDAIPSSSISCSGFFRMFLIRSLINLCKVYLEIEHAVLYNPHNICSYWRMATSHLACIFRLVHSGVAWQKICNYNMFLVFGAT